MGQERNRGRLKNDRGDLVLPAAPFIAWIRGKQRDFHDRLDALERAHRRANNTTEYAGTKELAEYMGVQPRTVFRWLRGLTTDLHRSSSGRNGDIPATVYGLAAVEDAMFRFGEFPWMIYPIDLLDDLGAPEPAVWCEQPSCQEHVTPIRGVCPWCDTLLVPDAWKRWVIERGWVPAELVTEAAFLHQQAGVPLGRIAAAMHTRAHERQEPFRLLLRDELRARDIVPIRGARGLPAKLVA